MTPLPAAALAATWRASLADHSVVHLDAAGCACPSRAVLDASVAHLRREAAVGGYAAEAEAAPAVASLRGRLGALVDLDADAVALAPNATSAFTTLLAAWPLPTPARVATVASDYESNRLALGALAARRLVELVDLDTDAAGHLDLDTLPRQLRGVDLLTFPVVASQRGIVQPAASAVSLARDAGIPVVLDVAQAAGQVALTGLDADGYVGTARKWLRGPRGTGWIAAAPGVAARLRPEYPSLVGRDRTGAGQLATGEAVEPAGRSKSPPTSRPASSPSPTRPRTRSRRPPGCWRRGSRRPRSPRPGPPQTSRAGCCGCPSTPTARPRISTAWSFHYGDSDNRLRA